MAKNSISIETPQLDKVLDKLDQILTALHSCGTPYSAPAETAQEDAEDPEPQTQADTPEEAEPHEGDKEPEEAVTMSDVQRTVVELSSVNKELKKKVRDIIKSYAERVSAIPEDKLSEVLDKLNALEG